MGDPKSDVASVPGPPRAGADRSFRSWQNRILYAALVGYALYYIVRKNLSMAMPAMLDDLHLKKEDLGDFITWNGLMYGLSKLVNGMLVDRLNARWFMVTGLLASAGLNVAFGLSSTPATLALFWALNGWFQGMGFPPAARLMTHWFSPKELATKMSIWNVSHSVGAGLVFVLCGYLVTSGWRLCFFVPAGVAVAGAVFLAVALRDTPESLGFPEVEGTQERPREDGVKEGFFGVLWRYVLSNPYIWLISFANFFVYIVRASLVDWAPTYLKEAKHLAPHEAGWAVGTIEFAGVFGMLAGGWVTDRWFGGRGTRTCLFCMIFCAACLFAFKAVPEGTPVVLEMALLAAAGFFMYGPQCLVGIIAANLGTKKAAATAGGLTGLFGYLSSIPAGKGVGRMADLYGWDTVYTWFTGAALIGAVLFALCWKAPADGYKK